MATGDLKTELKTSDLQPEFHNAFKWLLHASVEIDPFAIYTIKRLDEESGLHMAKRILATLRQQTGLLRLFKAKRLDLSMEALVLRPEFSHLFTEAELQTARKRLITLGYQLD